MNEFRKFAEDSNDAPEVGDIVQLLDDSGTPDINKVPIVEIVREVDRTSLTGDTGITPALSQVWEVKDDQGQNWMVARNPETDEGGKKGYLQVRIASKEEDKQLEMGIKIELEHKDTIEKFRKNPEMTDKEVAEMIANDHLSESKTYYTDLKAMESKASLLKESIIHTKNTGKKDSWDRELWRGDDGRLYVDVEGILHSMTSEGEPMYPAVNVVKGDAEDQLSNPIEDAKTKSHYDLNQSIASLLNLPIGSRVSLLRPFWGHKPGEIGKIDRNRKLRLEGSPPATIREKDIDDLFEILAPKLQGWPEMSVADVNRMSPYSNKKTEASLLKEERELLVPEKHQLRIAYDTLKMNDVMARVMGGMTKDEAKEIIKKLTGRDAKEGAVMNTKASLLKTETRNGDVIHIFLSDTFPKDMSKNWGTGNLKIVKEPDGWSLVNYWTRILYRGVGGKVYFNTKKYSQTTTSIQREIQSIAKELGVKLIPVEDDSLDESIKKDTTPESSPVETTPENPPLEEPQTTEEPDRNVIVTNASLLVEAGPGMSKEQRYRYMYQTLSKIHNKLWKAGITDAVRKGLEITGNTKDGQPYRIWITSIGPASNGEMAFHPTMKIGDTVYGKSWADSGDTSFDAGISILTGGENFGMSGDFASGGGAMTGGKPYNMMSETTASLLKKSDLQSHVMEVLTAAGVAHLVEWDGDKLRLVKKQMGSGSEFADEIIKALGNTGAFGTVTYDAENNQFNLGVQSEPQEVTITSVFK